MGQIPLFRRKSKDEQNIIFAYDLKSTSKHFIAGTLVINNVDDLVRYDDFTLIRQKKGLQIKSLSIYKAQNKIVGYEIIYRDAGNSKIRFRRIASQFNSFGNKVSVTGIKLEYNEHLSDFEVIYNQDEIKCIDVKTSKGKTLKVGMPIEGGYSSFNKIDITQKNYAPIIAFETTFSNDCLKEVFIYRCPVRITKRKQKRKLTVNELNHLKAAPSYETVRKARHNIDIMREFTKRGIAQLRVVRGLQGLAQQTKATSNSSLSPAISTVSPHFKALLDQNKTQEAYMQEQEYGAADEDDEEAVEEKKEQAQNALTRASQKFKTVFSSKKSSQSGSNGGEKNSRENSPHPSNKKSRGTLFNWRTSISKKLQKEQNQSSKDLLSSEGNKPGSKKATSHNDLDSPPKQLAKADDSKRKSRKSLSAAMNSQLDFKNTLSGRAQKQRTSIELANSNQIKKKMSFNIFAKTKMTQVGVEKLERLNSKTNNDE